MEEKRLYPFSFFPIAETFVWGGTRLSEKYSKSFVKNDPNGDERPLGAGENVAVSHELADLGYRDSLVSEGWLAGNTMSEIMDMYLDRVVGENVFDFYGRQFPVGVRFMDVRDRLPLMVCPDDETASPRYDFLGKAKLWYVAEAGPDAVLYLGFKEDTASSAFCSACADGSAESMLNAVRVKDGDAFFIAPGTVHGARGVLLLEVSESSPLDFCLCGWGREMDPDEFDEGLGLVEALDFIDFRRSDPSSMKVESAFSTERVVTLARCPQFTASRVNLRETLRIDSGSSGSYLIYTCISGACALQLSSEDGDVSYSLPSGRTLLVPAEVTEFNLVPTAPGTVLVEVMQEEREDADPYIDPDAAPTLPGEE